MNIYFKHRDTSKNVASLILINLHLAKKNKEVEQKKTNKPRNFWLCTVIKKNYTRNVSILVDYDAKDAFGNGNQCSKSKCLSLLFRIYLQLLLERSN